MNQQGILREVQLIKKTEPMVLLEIDKVLKLNLEDKAIDFEQSNQINQNWRSYWLDQRIFECQLELAKENDRLGEEFLNLPKNIWQLTWISQWGCSKRGKVLNNFFIRLRGTRQSTWLV